MKIKDMRKKTPQELHKLVLEKEGELREFRFSAAGSGKKDVRLPRTLRKIIARAKTVLNEEKA